MFLQVQARERPSFTDIVNILHLIGEHINQIEAITVKDKEVIAENGNNSVTSASPREQHRKIKGVQT